MSTEPAPQQPPQAAQVAAQAAVGNVSGVSSGVDSSGNRARTRARYPIIRDRLQERLEWPTIFETVREMRDDPKLKRMGAEAREQFIWEEMDRIYHATSAPPKEAISAAAALLDQIPRETGVKGLGEIPKDWPELPANASLAVEVGWVQANRLRIVEELAAGGTRVHLGKAMTPAPSWSALSWLETSIRSYAKFVEVAAKCAQTPDDEQAQVKRERLRIEEMKAILAEMLD